MIKISLDSLKPESTAVTDYYSESGDLLISKGTVISQRHLTLLAYRNNHDLLCNPPEPVRAPEPKIVRAPEIKSGKDELLELASSQVTLLFDNKLEQQIAFDRPTGNALRNSLTQIDALQRKPEYKRTVSNNYESAVKETEDLINRLVYRQNTEAADIEYIVRQFFKVFLTDHNILLNIANYKPPSGEYLFHHSLNVCLLSLNVAASYGYNEQQVLEIGMGALVHDIGMLLIPKSIREKPSRYTKEEWYEIQKHPITGLHLLEKVRFLPEQVAFVAYQVHERENGSGYPKQRVGRTIHRYAKIVQIADIFEALTAPRTHRQAAMPFDGMAKILQMSKAGLLSAEAVQSFIEYTSVYPVGSLVLLSDNRIAKVVHANKEAPALPVVSALTDNNGTRLAGNMLVQINLLRNNDVKIVRAIPEKFLNSHAIMDGF